MRTQLALLLLAVNGGAAAATPSTHRQALAPSLELPSQALALLPEYGKLSREWLLSLPAPEQKKVHDDFVARLTKRAASDAKYGALSDVELRALPSAVQQEIRAALGKTLGVPANSTALLAPAAAFPTCSRSSDTVISRRCESTSCNPPFWCGSWWTSWIWFLCPGGSKPLIRCNDATDGSAYNIVGDCVNDCRA